MSSRLEIESLVKRFAGARVLDGVSLAVEPGEIVALLGPSGSGKTTLLRCLAGFEIPDAGTIRIGGEDLTRLPPERRGLGMVFQHYALFPHLTVGENVAFGLDSRKLARDVVRARVASALARVDLAGFEARAVHQLSGGQQQRVALARALAPEPRVLLLDEPLSNLDPSLRERTRRELAALLRAVGISSILVTHEQEEAFDLGDRIALLHDGRLDQMGTAEELYREPATRFTARFIGRANFLAVELARREGEIWRCRALDLGGAELAARASRALDGSAAPVLGDRVEAMLRPEDLRLSRRESAAGAGVEVVASRFAGALRYVAVRTASGRELEVATSESWRAGERAALTPAEGAEARLFPLAAAPEST
ncbi:MAG: ABC transporter ATP-binding protein [Thermoanaerobaculia bacterium]